MSYLVYHEEASNAKKQFQKANKSFLENNDSLREKLANARLVREQSLRDLKSEVLDEFIPILQLEIKQRWEGLKAKVQGVLTKIQAFNDASPNVA